MNTKFADITNTSALIEYLKAPQRLNNVKSFSKYMRLSAVVRLFSSGMLLINNPSHMNDYYELNAFGKETNWSKTCFACFIAQSDENMAMWSMYAQPWVEGVMISVPVDSIKEMCQNTRSLIAAKYDTEFKRYSPDESEAIDDCMMSIIRVAYADGKTLTCTSRDDRNSHFSDPYHHPELAGYIKDAAWSYEKEIRLRIDLPDTYQQDAVFLKVPESVLNSISITTGPRFAGNMLTALPKQYRANVKIETSRFKEKLAWIPCDDCSKKD